MVDDLKRLARTGSKPGGWAAGDTLRIGPVAVASAIAALIVHYGGIEETMRVPVTTLITAVVVAVWYWRTDTR